MVTYFIWVIYDPLGNTLPGTINQKPLVYTCLLNKLLEMSEKMQ